MHSDDASTEQLLRELLEDPQVLTAEPNYLVSFAEEGFDDTATEEPPAAIPATEPEEAPAAPSADAIAEDEEAPAESPESEGAEDLPTEMPDAATDAESENVPDAETEANPEPELAPTETATNETDESTLHLQSSASKDLSGYQ